MVYDIGAIVSRSGMELMKMWRVQVLPGKRVLQKHHHTSFEIMTVLSGSGTYTTVGGDRPIFPGDVFIFSSNEFHCITDVGTQGLEIMNIQFEPRLFLSYSDDSYQNFCFSHAKSFDNRIPADKSEKLRSSILSIRRELETQDQGCSLAVRSHLNMIAVTLLRECGYQEDRSAAAPQMDTVLKAMAYIEEHLTESLSLSEIAAYSGMSPNYFSSLFKKTCNVSLWDYITAKRIEKAIRLILTDNGDTMLDIALACGFNNTANFNKAFRKQTGMTPTQYRSTNDLILS